uniref:Integrase catalytic domain-containing protein n=1 Tax=Bionectria ochroleuca TaxID=29856 RepID=A0A8H7N3T3_BIOOC
MAPPTQTPPAVPPFECDEAEEVFNTTKLTKACVNSIDWTNHPTSAAQITTAALADVYAARCIHRYEYAELHSSDLLGEFVYDFRGWSLEKFTLLNPSIAKELKRILRYGGIYTGPLNNTPETALNNARELEDLPEWPRNAQFLSNAFNPDSWVFQLQESTTRAIKVDETETPRISVDSTPQAPLPPQNPVPNPRPGNYTFTQYDPYRDLPPDNNLGTGTVPVQELVAFQKLYSLKEHSFGGEPYDMLDTKVRIMLNTCKSCNIQPSGFKTVLFQILKGNAQDFWFQHVKEEHTFREAYLKLKQHFDNAVNKQQYYHDWTQTNIASIRADRENRDLTARQILQKVFITLARAQKALGGDHEGDNNLKDAIFLEAEEGAEESDVLEEFEQWVQDLEGVEDRSETADHGDPDNHNNPDEEDQRASDDERQLEIQGEPQDPSHFIIEERYATRFQGIMPDTGASSISTVGKPHVKFGKGLAESLGITELYTPFGPITFYVMNSETPFLMCLHDMDRLNIEFRNVTDEVVRTTDGLSVPTVRKWGHVWFFPERTPMADAAYLTEPELRQLHRRFGYPSVERLYRLLERAGYEDVNRELQDDLDFNYEIIVDIMYLLDREPVLHVVCAATAFQNATFLENISADTVWEALKRIWLDTYLGPPDRIVHDVGTQFASDRFHVNARIMGSECKQIPIEAHWSIGKIERYHGPLQRAFNILYKELKGITSKEAILQAAVKAVNDTAGPNGLVLILLVFGVYPRVAASSPPLQSTIQRAQAANLAMKALRELYAKERTALALATRNGPNTTELLELPLLSEVMVWRESKGWFGPYRLLSNDSHNIIIETHDGPKTFRSTPLTTCNKRATTEKGATKRLKEQAKSEALELARKLRREGVIITPGAPFEASTKAEIEQLIKAGVFEFVRFGREVQSGQLFKARIVNEIKGQNAKPYEKSPPSLIRAGDHILTGRDITQAYPQSETDLQRAIYARLPELLEQSYPEGTVMRIIKPLYGIAESGVHWYATYHKHFTTRMKMMTSSYDPCLLIAGNDALGFGLIGMQTDDILGLFDEALAAEEEH